MDDRDKSKETLLEELTTLRGRVQELERRRAASREDRLKLAILDRLPFSMWACNREFAIVLWTSGSERIYGFRKEDAVGRNYLKLFVDDFECDQSEEDCLRIINGDYVQTNFLAFDKTQSGDTRTMLTNCFRIRDEDSKDYLQAEVAIDISDLDLRWKEFRTVREMGAARRAEKMRTAALQKKILLGRLQEVYSEKVSDHRRRQQDLDEWTMKLQDSVGGAKAEQIAGGFRHKVEGDKQEIQAKYKELFTRVSSLTTIEELDQIEPEVMEFATEDIDQDHKEHHRPTET